MNYDLVRSLAAAKFRDRLPTPKMIQVLNIRLREHFTERSDKIMFCAVVFQRRMTTTKELRWGEVQAILDLSDDELNELVGSWSSPSAA